MRNYFFSKYLFFIITLQCFQFNIIAENYEIKGKVLNKETQSGLSFANIRIDKTGKGTASNFDGDFILKLDKGEYVLICSYIGFKSDTIRIEIKNNTEINFELKPIQIKLSEVTVTPQENPAIEIIKKAIESKKNQLKILKDYKYSAYTKGIIKTTRELIGGNYTLSTNDTGKLKITGILENESRGFYKAPNNFKYYIVARKQTANAPPFINILTGGNIIQTFYNDELEFSEQPILSPISEKALNFYYYYIKDETVLDNKKIFQIYFAPEDAGDPAFFGNLYISDETFDLVKIDVNLNQAANPGGIFQFINIFQQFSLIDNKFNLPIDYRIFAEGNYLGLAKFGFEFNTIMYDYDINSNIDNSFFDNALISVLPEADKKDDSYWQSIQSIPNSLSEIQAYERIDSLTKIEKSFGEKFSVLGQRFEITPNLSTGGLFTIYRFNKVEGNTLNFDLFYNEKIQRRFKANLNFAYGFSDKKFKEEFKTSYLLGDYRTTEISVSVFNKINDLFGVSENYNKFTSTFLSLFTHYDFRDYYYSKGFNLKLSGEVFSFLNLGVGFFNRTDRSAYNNSNFAFFYKNKNYSTNKPIYDTKINAITASFKLDFRKYIEDGFFRRRITPNNYALLEGNIIQSSKDFLRSENNFTIYDFQFYGGFSTFNSASFEFNLFQQLSSGGIPFQNMYALQGNINSAGKNNSFRTLAIGEVFGDKSTSIFLRHNFRDEIFRLLQIPILKDLQINFSTYLNIAWSTISEKNKSILNNPYTTFEKPFYELGFSLGHILIPLTFEFTWKLNYRSKNNFSFGINTFAL